MLYVTILRISYLLNIHEIGDTVVSISLSIYMYIYSLKFNDIRKSLRKNKTKCPAKIAQNLKYVKL